MHLSAPNPPSAAKRKWGWCPKHDDQDDDDQEFVGDGDDKDRDSNDDDDEQPIAVLGSLGHEMESDPKQQQCKSKSTTFGFNPACRWLL